MVITIILTRNLESLIVPVVTFRNISIVLVSSLRLARVSRTEISTPGQVCEST